MQYNYQTLTIMTIIILDAEIGHCLGYPIGTLLSCKIMLNLSAKTITSL